MHRHQLTALWLLVLSFFAGLAESGLGQDIADREEQAIKQAALVADPSIVQIQTIGGADVVDGLLAGTGPTTGVIVGADGWIVTSSFNFSNKPASVIVLIPAVAAGVSTGTETANDSTLRKFPATIVSSDESRRVTLLKIEATGLRPLAIVPTAELLVGQWSLALGRTFDPAFPSISLGVLSALDRNWGRAVQTDAKISPANYGGPLVDIDGRGIGILVPVSPDDNGVSAGVEWYDSGIGFAAPLEDLFKVLPRLQAGERLKPGLLGITFAGAALVAPETKVDRVRPESPALKAGIKSGDIITAASGQTIGRPNQFRHLVGKMYSGEKLTISLKRGAEQLDVEATLVDSLPPYVSGYLGVLPARTPADNLGAVLRHVFDESPAAKAGLKAGDQITKVGGSPVTTAAELLDRVSRTKPAEKSLVTWNREGAEQSAEVTLGQIPIELPKALTVDVIPPRAEGAVVNKVGRFEAQLPGDERKFWVDVPDDYNPERQYGLVVWLHPPGQTAEAEMQKQWRVHAGQRGLILVGPRATANDGWTPDETDFVAGVVEWCRQEYKIDRARTVALGAGQGGAFAYHVAFAKRNLFGGIATIAAPMRQPPPDNDPEFRQQLCLISNAGQSSSSLIKRTAEGLRLLKFPVAELEQKLDDEQLFKAETVESLAVWMDLLDRI